MTAGPINIAFNPDEHHAFTPGGRYRYQLDMHNDSLVTVWQSDKDGSWLLEMMIELDETGGPRTVGLPPGQRPDTDADVAEDYMRAAGHAWAARTAGLWLAEGDD